MRTARTCRPVPRRWTASRPPTSPRETRSGSCTVAAHSGTVPLIVGSERVDHTVEFADGLRVRLLDIADRSGARSSWRWRPAGADRREHWETDDDRRRAQGPRVRPAQERVCRVARADARRAAGRAQAGAADRGRAARADRVRRGVARGPHRSAYGVALVGVRRRTVPRALPPLHRHVRDAAQPPAPNDPPHPGPVAGLPALPGEDHAHPTPGDDRLGAHRHRGRDVLFMLQSGSAGMHTALPALAILVARAGVATSARLRCGACRSPTLRSPRSRWASAPTSCVRGRHHPARRYPQRDRHRRRGGCGAAGPRRDPARDRHPAVVVASAMLLYAYFGQSMPGFLAHGGYSVDRIVSTSILGTEAVLGTPIDVSSRFIFLFMIFAAMLQRTGMERFFTQLAFGLTGGMTGDRQGRGAHQRVLRDDHRQLGGEHGQQRGLHHPDDEEVRLQGRVRRCRRGRLVDRRTAGTADHGRRRVHHDRVHRAASYARSSAPRDPGAAVLHRPVHRHPLRVEAARHHGAAAQTSCPTSDS
jgi:hypothetical protein